MYDRWTSSLCGKRWVIPNTKQRELAVLLNLQSQRINERKSKKTKKKKKRNKNKIKYLDLTREQVLRLYLGIKNDVEHERDGNTNRDWFSWNCPQKHGKFHRMVRNRRMKGDHSKLLHWLLRLAKIPWRSLETRRNPNQLGVQIKNLRHMICRLPAYTGETNRNTLHCCLKSNPIQRPYRKRIENCTEYTEFITTSQRLAKLEWY